MNWLNRSLWGWGVGYSLLHPWVAIPYYRNRIKWAWQRVFRGWDDRVIWSIEGYLSKHMPEWIEKLKENKQGVPIDCFPNPKRRPSERELEVAEEKWDDTLDQIAEGFRSAYKISDGDPAKPADGTDYAKFDNAMELLHKWFFDLLD